MLSDDAVVTEVDSFLTAKQALRQGLLTQRQSLTVSDWRSRSEAICVQLAQSEWVRSAQTILIYLSTRQEPDLSSLWLQHLSGRSWGLPRCVNKTLIWHEWQPRGVNQLQPGRYGILEPYPTLPLLSPDRVDLILVPAVACDQHGFRLGYGGGFYDRLFSNPAWAHKSTIGIVFDFAYLEQLYPDPWDYPLQAVCTENGMNLTQITKL